MSIMQSISRLSGLSSTTLLTPTKWSPVAWPDSSQAVSALEMALLLKLRFMLMADPFGHGFRFVPFIGRGYDENAD